MEAIGNVDKSVEDDVSSQESLGKDNSTDGGVIEGALEPLVGVRLGSILWTKNRRSARVREKGKISYTVRVRLVSESCSA
jgi:hypothetical protein